MERGLREGRGGPWPKSGFHNLTKNNKTARGGGRGRRGQLGAPIHNGHVQSEEKAARTSRLNVCACVSAFALCVEFSWGCVCVCL